MEHANARSNDPRAVRTRGAIKRAFNELVMESNAPRVTVKDLAERAGINRKTFYLHYETLDQLYDDVVNDIRTEFFLHPETTETVAEDFAGHATRFFCFLAQQPPVVERLVCAYRDYDFGEQLYLGQMDRYRTTGGNPFLWLGPDKLDLVLCFIRSTALDFYRRWVQSKKAVPADEAALLLSELTCNGVRNLWRGECPGDLDR